MKRLILTLLALITCSAGAQVGHYQNFCTFGSTQGYVAGLLTQNNLLSSQPSCTVTVYLTGTKTKATLYSNSTGTALANPFTASAQGYFSFYASTATNVDVTMSYQPKELLPPPTVTFTFTDIALGGSSGGSTPVTATPTASSPTGTYTGPLLLSFADSTPGSMLFYTSSTTGTAPADPTTASTVYSGQLSVAVNTIYKVIAASSGYVNSAIAQFAYTITGQPVAVAPTASPVAGTYTATQNVTLATSTTNASIYYTTDGSTPTTGSTLYSGPISVSASETIKAITVATGYTTSTVSSFAYTISTSGPSHMELASLGQNANMNGAMPFVGSAAYADVSGYAVDTANNQYVQTAISGAHLDVSQPTGTSSGIPYYVLNSATDSSVYWVTGISQNEMANGTFDSESDHTLIPMKAGIIGEGGVDISTCYTLDDNDHHGIIIDVNPANTAIYEMYNVRTCNGQAQYYSLTVRNLNHPFEIQGPKGRTSSDVAGMVIAPVVLGTRYEDYANGAWKHAVRWTMHLASKAPNGYETLYTGMGVHGGCGGGNCSDGRATVFGQRMRLKASYNCTTAPSGTAWSAQAVITCQGLKKYGAINADNGINMAVQGTYDSRWGDPGELNQILATDFETIVDPSQPGAYAAQVLDESPTGGTSTVIDQSNIFNYSGGAGPTVANAAPRPTIVSFTPSATSVTVGQPVTFNYVATNATVGMIDNAGGTGYGNTGSITWTPSATSTYRLTILGEYGWITGNPITVTVTGPQAPAPTSNVATGTYTTPQTVTLTSACSACAIHYTLDGTTPGQYSPTYSSPISITNNGANALKTITTGVAQGYLASNVAEFDITLNLPSAAAPVFSPAAGTYASSQNIAMTTATSGAGIYYTTDGTTPNASSAIYSSAISLPATTGVVTRTNLQAATIKYGYANAFTSGIYLVGTQAALNGTPTSLVTYATGHFGQAGVFSDTASSPSTYITLPAGFSPLNTTDGYTIDAWVQTTNTDFGFITGNSDDSSNGTGIASRFGTFRVYALGLPEFDSGITIADGNWHYVKATFGSGGVHTFVDGVAGASTTTVPGNFPASGVEIGGVQGGRFVFPGDIDEVAYRTGVDNSLTVPSAAYTGSETGMFALYHLDGNANDSTVRGTTPVAATPAFSPAAGTYSSAQTVSISSTTAGAAIYYTTDGTTPTTSSALYSSPISISATSTVKAIATHAGDTSSPVASAVYTIGTPASSTPTLVGASSNTSPANPATASYTFTSGNLGIVALGQKNASAAPSSLTCNGTSGTLIGFQSSTSTYASIAVYAFPNIAGGATTCTATTPGNASIMIAEFAGASTTAPYEGVVSTNASATPTMSCGAVTTTGANRLGLAVAMMDGAALSASSGYSTVFNDAAGDNIAAFSLPIPTAATTTLTIGTANAYDVGCVAFALKP